MVGIVGAGIAGVKVAIACIARGYDVVLFEKAHQVGGVWNTLANATSRVQVNEAAYRLDGKHRLPEYTRKDEILENFQEICEKYKLNDKTKFNSEVIDIAEIAQDKFLIKSRDTSSGDVTTTEVEKVFCCAGSLHKPRDITFPGIEKFEGEVFNSFGNDLEPSIGKDKNVVIIGNGAFAVDIARELAAHGTKKITLVARRPPNIVPKYFDYIINTYQSKDKFDRVLDLFKYFYPKIGVQDIFKENLIDNALHFKTIPAVSDIFFILYLCGRIELAQGHIEEINGHHVILDSGESIPADMVVKAVGFESEKEKVMDMLHLEYICPPCWINGNKNFILLKENYLSKFSKELTTITTGFPAAIELYLETAFYFFDQADDQIDRSKKLDYDEIKDAVKILGVFREYVKKHSKLKVRILKKVLGQQITSSEKYTEKQFLQNNQKEWDAAMLQYAKNKEDIVAYPFADQKVHMGALYRARVRMVYAVVCFFNAIKGGKN